MRRSFRIVNTIVVTVTSLIFLSGCWDRLDPENMAFVIAIGVDEGPQNDFLFSFAIAVPKLSDMGQSSGGGGNKVVIVHTIEGSNMASALALSQSFIARRLTLIHSKALIIGEGLARKGVMPLLSEAVRNREFRRTVNMITVKGKAKDYLQFVQPTTEQDVSFWFELELDPKNQGGTIPKQARFHEFIMDVESKGTGAISILSAPRPDVKKGKANISSDEKDLNPDAKQPIVSDQYAGKIKRTGDVPVEFFGSAVYKSSSLVGYLNGSETRILNMLRGELEETTWDFHDPSDKKLNLSMTMNADRQAKLKIKRKGDQVTAIFDVKLEGELISVQTKVNYTQPNNREKLEKSIQKQLHEDALKLLNKTIHQWNVDCYRINNRVVSTFSSVQEWDAFNWSSHLKKMKYEVNISFVMRRYGGQVGPAIEGDQVS